MRKRRAATASQVLVALKELVLGQDSALESIAPFVDMYEAGLAPEGRPVGAFLLLGPTGAGKTHAVESLAKVIHGSERSLLRIDCGEYQMDHEVAKLIGAPPGYLGHRETTPLLTQTKLNAVTSERSGLSIVLFDEIEKAAGSFARLLLGVLDKATLKLGDNSTVNFERSMIFLTSNLGASGMSGLLHPFGFAGTDSKADAEKLQKIAMVAVKKKFSPEFLNRIDVVSTFMPLSREDLNGVLDRQLLEFRRHVNTRLGHRAFSVHVSPEARELLLDVGTSEEYGARELRRTIQRMVIQPVAAQVSRGESIGAENCHIDRDGDELAIKWGKQFSTAGGAAR